MNRQIQESEEIKFALKAYSALDKNNYVRFFKLVKSTTYLNACILLRYFIQVRVRALIRILKCYSPRQPYTQYPISELCSILAFEDIDSTVEFLEYYGLSVSREGGYVTLDRKSFCQPDFPFHLDRAINIVESKRTLSVGEVVCGTKLPPKDYEKIVPYNSFDREGFLKLSEIPTEWHNKYMALKQNNLFSKDEPDSPEIEIIVESEDKKPDEQIQDKPKFTFCLPSKVEVFIFISKYLKPFLI